MNKDQKPHKLVIVLKGYPRLSETFIAQEILGLEQSGFELQLVSLRHPTDSRRHAVHDEIQAPVNYLPEYLHEEPVRVFRSLLRARKLPGFAAAFKAFRDDLRHDRTRNRVRRFGQAMVLAAEWPADAHWVYAHFIHTPASVAAYAARMLEVPWSVSAHAKDIWTSSDRELSTKLDSARWAVTCTAFGHRHLQSLASHPETVHLSYHGIDLQRFPAHQRPESVRDGSDAEDPVVILSVGRAVDKKGFDTLLRALAALPAELHWRFVHVGNGAERAKLQALAAELGIEQRISWLGAIDQSEVLANYWSSDLFVLACRVSDDGDRDGLPNVLVEAASQGLPCLSTRVSAIPELFTDGENALLVESEDVPALSAALARAITQPRLRDRLGAAAQDKVRSKLDHHASIAQLKDLFDSQWDTVE